LLLLPLHAAADVDAADVSSVILRVRLLSPAVDGDDILPPAVVYWVGSVRLRAAAGSSWLPVE
jgi:hypothetical protein